jgi:aldose 1-epimerase
MNICTLTSHRSKSRINLYGAHVEQLSLDGEEVIKPSSDGVPTHGGAAVLIPYAGRVRNGRYTFEGGVYQLPVGPEGHASHGFAKDTTWEVVEARPASVKLRAQLQGEGYPAILETEITYALGETTFSTDCVVKNVSTSACPLVVGFHPYFLARDWTLEAGGGAYKYELADTYFPTGKRVPFDIGALGPNTRLDSLFEVEGQVKLHSPSLTLTLQRRKLPYLILFNGKYAEGISLAIEPYSGLPDAYNNGIGVTKLEPGATFTCEYDVTLSRTH